VEVIQGVDPVIDQFSRSRDRAVFQAFSTQRCLRRLGAPGHRRRSSDTDTNVGTGATVYNDYGTDADDGVSRGLVGEFLVTPTVPFYRHRRADLNEDFVRLQGGRQEIEKELPRRNSPLTPRSFGDDRRIESEDRGWIVGGRIGVGERSTNCSPVANLPITNSRRGVREEWNRRPNLGVGRDLVMGGQGANRDLAVGAPHATQFWYAADVDQRFRLCQAQLHDRQQAVAAGNELGPLSMLLQESYCFVDASGALVRELGRVHLITSPAPDRD
jgi:hypothetical protein